MDRTKFETWYGGMWQCEAYGWMMNYPDDIFDQNSAADQCGIDPDDVFYEKGWWIRFSDDPAADWSGPFETKTQAIQHFYSFYGVGSDGEASEYDMLPRSGFHGTSARKAKEPKVTARLIYTRHPWTGDAVWAFMYGEKVFRFIGRPQYYKNRNEAVRDAYQAGWAVEEDNTVRYLGAA